MLNGGIIGALLDCHSNWTAAWHLMERTKSDTPPCTVTAEFHVKLRRPTPSTKPVHLVAKVVESSDDRATIEATLSSEGVVCATCPRSVRRGQRRPSGLSPLVARAAVRSRMRG
jgi:acyl-coenzyme A thioesterase PaaI-like protein